MLSLAQLFIVNWWKNVFTLHRCNNKYMFRLLTLAIIRLQLTINSCARFKISSILIYLFERNGDAEPYDYQYASFWEETD